MPMDEIYDMELIYSLLGYPDETEWLEFKESNTDPERIARDISALANAAAFHGRSFAYKLWGVEDATHRLIGTTFDPYSQKVKGNQGLHIWLKQVLSANASYEFLKRTHDGLSFVVLRIACATDQPVCFNGDMFIREGSSSTPLPNGSSKAAELWRRLQRVGFERRTAREDLILDEVRDMLDVDLYFSRLGLRTPDSTDGFAIPFVEQDLLIKQDDGRFSITNLGALVLARRLSAFPTLAKRCVRVLIYAGKGCFDVLEDHTFDEGYASALPMAEQCIASHIPTSDVLEGAFRRIRPAFPKAAIRELLANAVFHQDLTDTTAGPLVGIHPDRIDFSNPGTPLIPKERFLNARPKTRNAALVRIMRQMDLCEEAGTGWDRAVASCEEMGVSAPKIESAETLGTIVTLFAERSYERMTKTERKDALYWHACLFYEQGESIGNQSLRERFGLNDERKNVVAISRLIKECCEDGLIREEDEGSSAKFRRYIPIWA